MSVCINKNSIEYQSLKNRAGISEFMLEAVCRNFLEKYDRLPYLDELPGSNSEQNLKNTYHIKLNDSVSISELLDITGKETVEEAVIDINNIHRDLEVKILPILEKAIIDIKHRPAENNFTEVEQVTVDNEANSSIIFRQALDKLASLYGIKFNDINDSELKNFDIPDIGSVNAFVYNNQIYINTDRANIDAPIHEMFHILIGSMRFLNQELYLNLIDSVYNLPNYYTLSNQFRGRTRNDINEEIFITELAKYFSGMQSYLTNLDLKSMYELIYNIKRTLDTILMGNDSVKTISNDRLYNMTLKEIIKEVNSSIATSNFNGFINVEGSGLHRKLNNIKSELLENKLLLEDCD